MVLLPWWWIFYKSLCWVWVTLWEIELSFLLCIIFIFNRGRHRKRVLTLFSSWLYGLYIIQLWIFWSFNCKHSFSPVNYIMVQSFQTSFIVIYSISVIYLWKLICCSIPLLLHMLPCIALSSCWYWVRLGTQLN